MKIKGANCLLLRSFNLSDSSRYFKISNDPMVKEYVIGSYSKSQEHAIKNVEYYMHEIGENQYNLVVEKDGIMVGYLIVNSYFRNVLEIACVIDPEQRGKGIMLEAVKVFFEWFKENHQNYIARFIVHRDNESSNRMIQKIPQIRLMNEYPQYNVYEVDL